MKIQLSVKSYWGSGLQVFIGKRQFYGFLYDNGRMAFGYDVNGHCKWLRFPTMSKWIVKTFGL